MEHFVVSRKARLAVRIPNPDTDFSTRSRSYKNNLPTEGVSLRVLGGRESDSRYLGVFRVVSFSRRIFKGVRDFFGAAALISRV